MVPVRIICDEFATPFERSDAITPCNECGDGNNAKDVQLFNRSLPEDDPSDMLFDVPFVNEEQCTSGMFTFRLCLPYTCGQLLLHCHGLANYCRFSPIMPPTLMMQSK